MSRRQQLLRFLGTPTVKLAGTYLAIIMLMSVSFSIIFYNTSAQQFSRPIPGVGQSELRQNGNVMFNDQNGSIVFNDELRRVIDERFAQTRRALKIRLVWINLSALVLGSVISYILARRSLQPIEEAMEAQTQFVSDASHELRTPLTVLQTTNEVALRRPKLPAADARDLIAHNVEEVKKLRHLSNMLLELLKNNDAEVIFAPVNLQDVVSDALGSVVAVAQDKDITIEDQVPKVYALTSKELLARIVVILLDNAVKYSEAGKVITISAKQTEKKVFLSVTDQGIGIRASDLPHIFRRFYRADKSRSVNDTHGYGLGLAIADKLSEQSGAKIHVSSTLGKGSTFAIELSVPSKEDKSADR